MILLTDSCISKTCRVAKGGRKNKEEEEGWRRAKHDRIVEIQS